ncbi:hypothetical protein [Mangrovibacillus cuniculi]|uniref:Uncharacterized protein n=1 Tax=Mangrovibacillus cuniculi TaxID=2593652 RepID=A0A7S8CCK5_9BACI|nr:hypothetical protein [Mangrovibacillus cuniculi]QPC47507.1 hypothetical protein G8O30_11390 [Mangrovibacillus cuniculi]
MGIILFISFIIIVALGITNREEVMISVRSSSTIFKIGVFTLVTGIIFLISGGILGFGELSIINSIISICFLVTLLCLMIGILKFISLTSFSFNRKVGIFSLITGFVFAVMSQNVPFFSPYYSITYIFYIVAVLSLIVDVYKFIFGTSSQQDKISEVSTRE